jgi:3-dehydro-glucose-6-phosphate--glutamate transaminase
LSDDDRICEFVREWRDYGDREPGGTRLNDKMSDITAALAAVQLQQLNEFVARRAVLAMRYQDALAPMAAGGAIGLPRAAQDRVWYRYAVEIMDGRSEAIIAGLSARHIDSAVPVSDWRRDGKQRCSVADRAYRNLVSLPLYPTLSMDEQDAVITALKEVICR